MLPQRQPQSAQTGQAAENSAGGLELEFAHLSDVGRVRGHNEDFLGHAAPESNEDARHRGWFFAVADGVGGEEFGEVASKTAIEAVVAGFQTAPSGEMHSALLQRLVQAANIKVYETARGMGPGGVRMATTIVSCALRYDRVTVAHVGDSRCYLIRRGHALALTRDHTLVNDQVRLGVLSAKAAVKAEMRHVLSRSLGGELFVSVDVSEHHVQSGDILLLCSDGLHGALTPQEIAHATGNADLNAAAQELVDLANENDGGDNVSVFLIRIRKVERVGMYRGRPYKLR